MAWKRERRILLKREAEGRRLMLRDSFLRMAR